VSTATSETACSSFPELARAIRRSGLFDRRPLYYAVTIGLSLTAFAAGWTALVLIGNSWATLGIAAFLGVMFTQFGFLGHDAGHQQIFASRRANRLFGLLVGNALIGLSFGWWVPKHTAHHAHPNEVGRDPDIGDGGAYLTPASGAAAPQRRLDALLARWQAPLFFPLMLLRSIGMHVLGAKSLLRQRDRIAAAELSLMALHSALYLSAVLWVLSPVKALAFVVVQQAVFSVYLGCSFAPNHKGMPLVDDGLELGFAERQVITARNVSGGPLVTLLLGGLNYQIEHHLFPSMPRANLKRAQGAVKEFCHASGFGYREDSVVGSLRQILRHLAEAGARHARHQGLVAARLPSDA
jgi:fatty acid desaturase